MDNGKRMILAVGVIFLMLILYPVYLKWVNPPKEETAGARQTQVVEKAQPAPYQAPRETPQAEESYREAPSPQVVANEEPFQH